MGVISYIKGFIYTTVSEEPLFIKHYYNNGKCIKVTITNNEKENISFSGDKESKMCLAPPNYRPLMAINDILSYADETSYFNYSEIKIKNTKRSKMRSLPFYFYKYDGIKDGCKITLVDEVNDKVIIFSYDKEKEIILKYEKLGKTIFPFGQYKGETISDVSIKDKDYVNWVSTIDNKYYYKFLANIKTYIDYEKKIVK